MRPEIGILKHHAQTALVRRAVDRLGWIADRFAIDCDLPRMGADKPRNRREQGALARSGSSQETGIVARLQIELDVTQNGLTSVVRLQPTDVQCRHACCSQNRYCSFRRL